MKNVPHWQLLMLIYFFTVAIPVYFVHSHLKKRALTNRTFGNLILYTVGVIGTAFIMHSITMWFYFTFFFTVKD
jgi:hypothetical protein